ncbi:hypothetical protein PVAP13_4NG085600 [Panicum virgatum]|uniref:Reticulon-like protein n=1 Tax=Panicum virgatum TaxID=38727 RepID=A0A8T0TB18_PANVG|nr:hypothetical protein PVAP13_4NG085600 [Panicum virgatum]
MADPAVETVAAPPPTPAAPAKSASDPPLQSPADAASPEKVSPPAPASAPETRSRGFRLLGEDTSVHKALGGGKTADVLLWKDKKTSAVVIATTFIKKSPPDIPLVQIPEDLVVNVSRALRNDINRALHLFREIAMGHDLKKFLGAIVGLWILSGVGSCCDFLTLIYIAILMLHMVPILYDKYQDKVDHLAGRAHTEARKQYEVLDAKVLSKIPRGPAKPKKQN